MSFQAIFFDMDGTLISTKSGARFPKSLEDWKPIPGIANQIEAACSYYDVKMLLIVSNQSKLGSKSRDEQLKFKTEKMEKVAEKVFPVGIPYDCAFAPNKDHMRKPNTGMADAFAEMYNLDLSKCLMVGDASDAEKDFSDSDKQFAVNAGMEYLDIKDFLNLKM